MSAPSSVAPEPLKGSLLYTSLLRSACPLSPLGQPFKRDSLSQAPSSLTESKRTMSLRKPNSTAASAGIWEGLAVSLQTEVWERGRLGASHLFLPQENHSPPSGVNLLPEKSLDLVHKTWIPVTQTENPEQSFSMSFLQLSINLYKSSSN